MSTFSYNSIKTAVSSAVTAAAKSFWVSEEPPCEDIQIPDSASITSDAKTAIDNSSSLFTMEPWVMSPGAASDDASTGTAEPVFGWRSLLKGMTQGEYGSSEVVQLPNGDSVGVRMSRHRFEWLSETVHYMAEIFISDSNGNILPDCHWMFTVPNDQHGPGMYVGYVAELLKKQVQQLRDAGWDDDEALTTVRMRIANLQESVVSRKGKNAVTWSEAIQAFKAKGQYA